MMKKGMFALSIAALALLSVTNSYAADWAPVSSEKLVQLPSAFLDRHVERSFNNSALAQSIQSSEVSLQSHMQQIQQLQQEIDLVEGDQQIALRHQLLLVKSDYLDTVDQHQQFRQQALDKKFRLYQEVISKLKDQGIKAADPIAAEVMADQYAARQRMQAVIPQVDEVLLTAGLPNQSSPYAKDYNANLAKIKQLSQAINQHQANAGPQIAGEDVSREDFVRHLIADVESKRAILDQEQQMLRYMSQLVALDAQILEQEVVLSETEAFSTSGTSGRLADAADVFIY